MIPYLLPDLQEAKMKINLVTLGCSKNLVDSEILLKQFKNNGAEVSHDANSGSFDAVLINTCGFIGDAKEESINEILQWVQKKKTGKVKKVIVFGCLSERYLNELSVELPEVDHFFGTNDIEKIIKSFEFIKSDSSFEKRVITTAGHFEFLKISEGCNRSCSFCAIPLMRGKHKSKPIESLVAESRYLAGKGVKELILIAQDLSSYGIDLYGKQKLASLLEKLSRIDGIEWIRLHYAYPSQFPMDILPIIAQNPKLCKYLDIAFQHISNPVLKAMRRNISTSETYSLIEEIRKQVPGIALRTSLMVGHPGETEVEFNELVDFVSQVRFERMGVFTYSHEEDTYSFKNFSDSVSDETKEARREELMKKQESISLENNLAMIGKEYKVIIDRKEDKLFYGRTEFDSPEIDNEVIITSKKASIGSICNVKITNAYEFDLQGEII